jgi:multidrug resistance efflux pump
MLEFLACSFLTILPDYLFRRFAQGKRLGYEINLYSVWYELRWGITSCAILTVALITVIFFYHPTTSNVSSLFRTVTVLSEKGGRVEEVFVATNQKVEAGQPLFKMVDSVERADLASARARVGEIDAAIALTTAELAAAEGLIQKAQGAFDLAATELRRMTELDARNANVVTEQQLDALGFQRDSTEGALKAAAANRGVIQTRLDTVLPAERVSALTKLEEAEAELAKMTVYADIPGTLEQFLLQPGDIVNPILRPAGILVPSEVGRERFQAGFRQIAAPVIKVGMIAEITCSSKPFAVIPMVVIEVQDVLPSGQFRPGDRLIDPQDLVRPGTVFTTLAPLYEGQAEGIPPGSKCLANAYTDNHDLIASGDLSAMGAIYYHIVDALSIVQAILLRVQAVVLPVQILVLSGH